MLVEDFKADVNAKTVEGETIMTRWFSHPMLGRYLVARGVNILEKGTGPHAGMSALEYSAMYGISWVLEAFVGSAGETALLANACDSDVKRYVMGLIRAGFARAAEAVLSKRDVAIDPTVACDLLDELRMGNFDGMREPIETYQLLEQLGAEAEVH
jgi:hypothetical protein